MKSVSVFLLVTTLCLETSVLAATTKKTSSSGNVLLETVTSGGYTPPDSAGWEHGVRIYVDGRVELRTRKNDRTPMVVKPIARLDNALLKKASDLVRGLKAGEIKFPANEPMCVDAATTSYRVGTDGVEFSLREGCRDGYIDDSAAHRLRYTLEGLRSVAALVAPDSL